MGYLYECDNLNNIEQPTQINCAYTCTENVKIDRVIKISDLYEYFVKRMELGLFKIKSFNNISQKEMSFVMQDIKNTVEKYDLKNNPNNPMFIFINEHFPTVI